MQFSFVFILCLYKHIHPGGALYLVLSFLVSLVSQREISVPKNSFVLVQLAITSIILTT